MFIFRNNELAKVMLCNGNIVFIKCKGIFQTYIARLYMGSEDITHGIYYHPASCSLAAGFPK